MTNCIPPFSTARLRVVKRRDSDNNLEATRTEKDGTMLIPVPKPGCLHETLDTLR